MEENNQKTLLQRVKENEEKLAEITADPKAKDRKYRLPRKAKVSKRKARQGYAVILEVGENNQGELIKKKIEGSTFELDTRGTHKTYHATEGNECIYVKGVPFYVQYKSKLNPLNLRYEGNNETYGQPYIMARMMGDAIKLKKQASGMIWIVVGLIALAVIGKLLHWY